jgi:hypothetical protein
MKPKRRGWGRTRQREIPSYGVLNQLTESDATFRSSALGVLE